MERLTAACGPRLRTILSRVTVRQIASDEFELEPAPQQRAMVEAHLAELKPIFEKALDMHSVSLRLIDPTPPPSGAAHAGPGQAIRSNVDAELEHPLVREVANLFSATPKRVEPRGKRG
ncbi:MAG: hypothetical protein Kow0022_06670 [Phycisphaerales bacterium]